MTEPSLGLVMIVRDEAHNLPRSLLPVAGRFDEVVVVDTGSSDSTPELCARAGARVLRLPWSHDFAAARNYSIEHAKADWLFWLDADNAIVPEQVDVLRGLLPHTPAILWAREELEPRGGRLWQKRCFPRLPGVRFAGRVHEQLVHPARWPELATPLVVRHWGYADPARNQEKGRYYLGLLQQSLEEYGPDFYTLFQLGRCQLNLRRFDEAEQALAQVCLDADARAANRQIWRQAHVLRSQALERLGRDAEARALIDLLLENDPADGLAHYHSGRLAFSQGQWRLAEQRLDQAVRLGLEAPVIDLDPEQTIFRAHYFRGRSLARLGEPDRAAGCLEQALAVRPHNQAAREELARLLLALDRPEQALGHIEQLLELNPANRAARGLLAQAGA